MTSGRRHRHSPAGRSGVTLVELMVVVAIFSIITGLVYGIFISQIRAKGWQDQVFETQQNVRGAMDLMVSEMRKAEMVNSLSGDCTVIGAGSTDCNRISFKVWNRELETFELLSYYTSGVPSAEAPTTLLRYSKPDNSSLATIATVADNVTDFSITCFDQTGNEMMNIKPEASINVRKARLVVTGITGRPNPNTGERVRRTLVSTIEFRNAWRYSGSGCGILNFRVTPNTVAFCNPPGNTAEIGVTLTALAGTPMGGIVTISPKLKQPISITGPGIQLVAGGVHEMTVSSGSGTNSGNLMVNDPSSIDVRAGTSIELVAKWTPANCSYAIATSRALGIKAGDPYKLVKGYGASMIANATLSACSDDKTNLFVKLEDNCNNLIGDKEVTFTIVGATGNPDNSKGGIYNSNSDPVLRYTNIAEEKNTGWYNSVYEAGKTAQTVTIEAYAASIVLPANQKQSNSITLSANAAHHLTVTSKDAALSSGLAECPGATGSISFQVQDECSNPLAGQAGKIELGVQRDGEDASYWDTGALSLNNAAASDLTYTFDYKTADACGEGGIDRVRIDFVNSASPGLTAIENVSLIKCDLPGITLSITEKKNNDIGQSGLPGGCNDTDHQVKVIANVTVQDCEPANAGATVMFTVESPTAGKNAIWAESGADTYTTAVQNVPAGLAGAPFVAYLRGGNAKVGDTLTVKAVATLANFGNAKYYTDPDKNKTIDVIGSSARVKFYTGGNYISETTRYTVPKRTTGETGETGYLYAEVTDCNRNHDSGSTESVSLNLESDNASGILNSVPFTLYETNPTTGVQDPNAGVFRNSIPIKRTAEIGKLLVDKGGIITASYIDADNPADTEAKEITLSGCREMRIKNLAGNEITEVDPKKSPYPAIFNDVAPHTFHVEVDVPYYKNGIINSGSSGVFAVRTCVVEPKDASDAVGLAESADDGVLKVNQAGKDYVYVLEGADNPEASGLIDPLGVWVTYSPQRMKVYYPDISDTCDDTLDAFIDEGCSVDVHLADVDQPSVVLAEPCAEEITPAVQNSVTVNFTASDGATGFINSAALWRETADSFGTCNPVGNAAVIQSYNSTSTNYRSINWGGARNIGILNTVDLSALIDGVYAIYAKATDNEGNTGTSNICCLTKDVMPPGVMINSPANGSTVRFIPQNLYTGVSNDPYMLDYTFIANDMTVGLDNAVVYLANTATSSVKKTDYFNYNGETSVVGAGDFDVTALYDGWYNIYVTAWDMFRNSSTSDVSYKVLLNRLGAFLWEPSANALINGATEYYKFDYWDGPGGMVTNAILIVNSPAGVKTNVASYTPNANSGHQAGAFDTSGFVDGDYDISVKVWDNDGKTAISNRSTISIDNALPGVTLNLPLNLPLPGALINNTLSYQFTATDNRALVNSTVYLTETADGTLHTFSHSFASLTSVTQNGSFDTSAYDDGPYTIYVKVWDEHGNSRVSATHNIMINRLKAVLYLPADNAIVNGPAVPFQFEYWDGPAGSLADYGIYASDGFVDYLVFNSPVGNPGNHAVVSGSFDSNILPDGFYDFYVEVIDNNGNSLDSARNLNIRVKNNPPDRPALIEPVNGAEFIMNTVPYHFTGADAALGIDNAVIHLYSLATSSDRDTDAFTYPLNSFVVNTTGFFNTTTYNDGPYEVWVNVYDRLGNMNASAPHHSIMVDRMRAMLNTPADGAIINGPAYGYDFFYSDGLGGTVTNAILIINSAAGVKTNVASYTPNANSGHQAGAFNTGAYTDGLYDLIVKVIDNHGNTKYSNRNDVRIKNTPPAITLDIPASNVTVTNALAYQATATDNVIGIREISVILTNTASGATTLSATTSYVPAYPKVSTIMNGTFNTSGVNDGRYRIRATAKDRVGNPASSVTRDVMVNRLTATMLTPATGAIVNGTMSFSFSYFDGVGGKVTDAKVYARPLSGPDYILGAYTPGNRTGTITDSIDSNGAADGLYGIFVTVTDNDGNTFTSASNTGIRVKNNKPVVTLNTPLDGAVFNGALANSVAYDFTANDAVLGINNAIAYFTNATSTITKAFDYSTPPPVANTPINQSGTFNTAPLNDGLYDVYVRVFDPIGNVNASAPAHSVMIDRLRASMTAPSAGAIVNGNAVSYQFSYADGPTGTVLSAKVYINNGSTQSEIGSIVLPGLNSGTASGTFDSALYPDGAYTIYVRVTDNHGNNRTSAPSPFTIDNNCSLRQTASRYNYYTQALDTLTAYHYYYLNGAQHSDTLSMNLVQGATTRSLGPLNDADGAYGVSWGYIWANTGAVDYSTTGTYGACTASATMKSPSVNITSPALDSTVGGTVNLTFSVQGAPSTAYVYLGWPFYSWILPSSSSACAFSTATDFTCTFPINTNFISNGTYTPYVYVTNAISGYDIFSYADMRFIINNTCRMSLTTYRLNYAWQASDRAYQYVYYYINGVQSAFNYNITATDGIVSPGAAGADADGYYFFDTGYVMNPSNAVNITASGTSLTCPSAISSTRGMASIEFSSPSGVVTGDSFDLTFRVKNSEDTPYVYVGWPLYASFNPASNAACTLASGLRDFTCTYNISGITDGSYSSYVYGRSGSSNDYGYSYSYHDITVDTCQRNIGFGSYSDDLDATCPSANQPGSYAEYFNFSLGSAADISIALSSWAFDSKVFLINATTGAVISSNDALGVGVKDVISASLGAGNYRIEATSALAGATGWFDLSLSDCSMLTPIWLGGSIWDDLNVGCESTNQPGSYSTLYEFSLAGPTDIAASVQSWDFDSKIFLINAANGAVMASNNNPGAGAYDVVRATLGAGTYRIEVTSASAGATGWYTVYLLDCGSVSAINVGDNLWDNLRTGCTSDNQPGSYRTLYNFSLAGPRNIRIDLQSWDYDSKVFLINATTGAVITSNDALGVGSWDSIQMTLGAGDYRIESTSVTPGATGWFNLKLSEIYSPAVTLYSATLMLDTVSTSPNRGAGYYSDSHSFVMPADGTVTITLDGAGYDTYLYLMNAGMVLITSNDDCPSYANYGMDSGLDSCIVGYWLAAGTYNLDTTTYGSGVWGSNYTVKVMQP